MNESFFKRKLCLFAIVICVPIGEIFPYFPSRHKVMENHLKKDTYKNKIHFSTVENLTMLLYLSMPSYPDDNLTLICCVAKRSRLCVLSCPCLPILLHTHSDRGNAAIFFSFTLLVACFLSSFPPAAAQESEQLCCAQGTVDRSRICLWVQSPAHPPWDLCEMWPCVIFHSLSAPPLLAEKIRFLSRCGN